MIKSHMLPKVKFLGEAPERTCISPFHMKRKAFHMCHVPLSPLLRSALVQKKWWAPTSSSNLNRAGVDLYSNRRLILHQMKFEPTSKSLATSLHDATGKESLTHESYSEVGRPIHFRSDTSVRHMMLLFHTFTDSRSHSRECTADTPRA